MYDAIERESPDTVIHLGDCVEDARDLVRSYPNLAVLYVRGNNDFEQDASFSAVVSLGGVRIYLTHGHQERVSRSSRGVLPRRAREAGCTVAMFGHTHRVFHAEEDGVLLLNPGSISLPRGGPASYLRLAADNGRLLEVDMLEENGQPHRGNEITTGWI